MEQQNIAPNSIGPLSYYEIALDGPRPHSEVLKSFVKAMDNKWAKTAFIDHEWLPYPWSNDGFEESLIKASVAFPDFVVRIYEETKEGSCTFFEAKNGKLFITVGKMVFDYSDRSEYIPASLSKPIL